MRKRKAEEERVEDLKQQLATAQAELQQQEFDETRTTNRLLSKKEAELNRAEKRLEAERSEYQFMQATVQPVKVSVAICSPWHSVLKVPPDWTATIG